MIQVLMKTGPLSCGAGFHEELVADPMLTSFVDGMGTWNNSNNVHHHQQHNNYHHNQQWDRFEGSVISSSPTTSLTDDWISELYNPSGFASSSGHYHNPLLRP